MLIKAVLRSKCPRCRKGDLFIHSNPYKISKLAAMHKRCDCCGQLTEPEPGFYFGAMYVSYTFGVVLFAILFVLVEFVLEIGGFHFMWIYTLVMLSLWPVIFRLSRIIYLYAFVSYDKRYAKKIDID